MRGARRPQEGQFGLREWEPDGAAPLQGLQALEQQPAGDGAGAPASAAAAGASDRAQRRGRQAEDAEQAQADVGPEPRVLPGRVGPATGTSSLTCSAHSGCLHHRRTNTGIHATLKATCSARMAITL